MGLLPKIWAGGGFLDSASDDVDRPRSHTAREWSNSNIISIPHAPLTARASGHPFVSVFGTMEPSPPRTAPPIAGPRAFQRTASQLKQSLQENGARTALVAGGPGSADLVNVTRLATSGLTRPPPSIVVQKPAWWTPDAKEVAAISGFDQRHKCRLIRANQVLSSSSTSTRPSSPTLLLPALR